MLSRRCSREMPGWDVAAAALPDTSPSMSSSLTLAVITGDEGLYRRIETSFAVDGIGCRRIDPERDSVIRLLQRDAYCAVVYDIGQSLDAAHALFDWRACHADRSLPIVVMARIPARDIYGVFRAGAGDVVLHPFDLDELRARTHALLWRSGALGREPDWLQLGQCSLDKTAHAGSIYGEPVRLTANEFTMAWFLFSKVGECLSRKQIASAVWGCSEDIVARSLEQHIYRLRQKLQLDGRSGLRLRTLYAHGYVLELREKSCALPPAEPLTLQRAAHPNEVSETAPPGVREIELSPSA